MGASWTMSSRFVGFLEKLISDSDFALSVSAYYPSILWSLGGTMQAPDGTVTPIAPRYDVGLVEKNDAKRFKLLLSSKTFGYVIFDPKPERYGLRAVA